MRDSTAFCSGCWIRHGRQLRYRASDPAAIPPSLAAFARVNSRLVLVVVVGAAVEASHDSFQHLIEAGVQALVLDALQELPCAPPALGAEATPRK